MKRKITDKLLEWKNKGKRRKPLILNGARQVGKTYILREFGVENYKNVIYINLETNLAVSKYFDEDISPERIIRFLEATANDIIVPEQTLIILDEIQSCERALTSLKYFCEEAPEYHVVAAGSLLGVAINREKYSFPVGKVDTLTLYPLDFEEFLWANNQEILAKTIIEHYTTNEAMPEALHNKAMEMYKLYIVVGGLPGVVTEFIDNGKLLEISDTQNKILNDYIADMSKYATNTESVKIRGCYNSIPNQLAKDNKKFQYKLVQRGGTSTIFGASIDWLQFAGIVMKCQKISAGLMPISVYGDLSSFKLYMGDVGLLTMKSGISHNTILSVLETDNIFLGAITENYVAQELTTKGYHLYYWESNGIAEIDFILQKGDDIIPIEVKSGNRTRSKSLSIYTNEYKPKYSIRISSKNFGYDNNIKAVPLYAVFNI